MVVGFFWVGLCPQNYISISIALICNERVQLYFPHFCLVCSTLCHSGNTFPHCKECGKLPFSTLFLFSAHFAVRKIHFPHTFRDCPQILSLPITWITWVVRLKAQSKYVLINKKRIFEIFESLPAQGRFELTTYRLPVLSATTQLWIRICELGILGPLYILYIWICVCKLCKNAKKWCP